MTYSYEEMDRLLKVCAAQHGLQPVHRLLGDQEIYGYRGGRFPLPELTELATKMGFHIFVGSVENAMGFLQAVAEGTTEFDPWTLVPTLGREFAVLTRNETQAALLRMLYP